MILLSTSVRRAALSHSSPLFMSSMNTVGYLAGRASFQRRNFSFGTEIVTRDARQRGEQYAIEDATS